VIPGAALRDPNSIEMLRVWIAEKSLWCSLRIGMYRERGMDEPAAWGTILADAARHIANALADSENLDRSETLQKIQREFANELGSTTSPVSGEFVKRN
jgi:hypothetical protein